MSGGGGGGGFISNVARQVEAAGPRSGFTPAGSSPASSSQVYRPTYDQAPRPQVQPPQAPLLNPVIDRGSFDPSDPLNKSGGIANIPIQGRTNPDIVNSDQPQERPINYPRQPMNPYFGGYGGPFGGYGGNYGGGYGPYGGIYGGGYGPYGGGYGGGYGGYGGGIYGGGFNAMPFMFFNDGGEVK